MNTHDFSNIGYVSIADVIYPDIIKEKSKIFPYCLEKRQVIQRILQNIWNNMFLNHKNPLVN